MENLDRFKKSFGFCSSATKKYMLKSYQIQCYSLFNTIVLLAFDLTAAQCRMFHPLHWVPVTRAVQQYFILHRCMLRWETRPLGWLALCALRLTHCDRLRALPLVSRIKTSSPSRLIM